MIREKFNEIIYKIFEKTLSFYKDNLISFVVFGSCGRETPNNESDIDLLIILNNTPRGRINRNLEFYKNVEILLEDELKNLRKFGIDTYISPIIKTKEEVFYGSPIFLEMTEKVKIIFDKDEFFKNYLKELKKKMTKYGTKKIKDYWIYKEKVDKEEVVDF
ncbi:MAG: nucleotidyltransferase domain-containing protein [Caldisericia bacterium]